LEILFGIVLKIMFGHLSSAAVGERVLVFERI